MFTQILDPTGNLFVTWLVALVPVVLLLFLLAGLRMSAWLAVLIGSIVTFLLALWVWKMPFGDGVRAYLYGSATGVWYVDWITFWGVMLFNTMVTTGSFDKLRRWLIQQGTRDVRVQTILFAWAFGALLEGLVGFGYPWAFVAPILITLGIPALDAIRVAAIANNAPVSYGALGAPIITLAAVTGMPLLALAGAVGKIVAILALLPPWILLYLVSGRQGMKEAWPLAVVGSLGYIAGQLPTSVYLGPYLPDVIGAIVCFACLLLLLKVWRPARTLGYGGIPVTAAQEAQAEGHGLSPGEVFQGWLPIIILVVIVVAWTGPWSKLPAIIMLHLQVTAATTLTPGGTIAAVFNWTPFVGGTAILASWIIVALVLRINGEQLVAIFKKTWRSDVGRLPRRRVHLRAGLCLQLLGHGGLACQSLLRDRAILHHRCAPPRLHRRSAVRQQHLDQRHVREVPGAGRTSARLPADAVAGDELGRRRDRQTDRAANRQRRRVHQRVRPQRGRGDPPQFRLDARAAGLSRADRHRLLSVLPRHRGVAAELVTVDVLHGAAGGGPISFRQCANNDLADNQK